MRVGGWGEWQARGASPSHSSALPALPRPAPRPPQPLRQPVRAAQHGARPAVLAGRHLDQCQLPGGAGGAAGCWCSVLGGHAGACFHAWCWQAAWCRPPSAQRSAAQVLATQGTATDARLPRAPGPLEPRPQALRHYGAQPGPHQRRAAELAQELRGNLVQCIVGEYRRTGYLWEQYDDQTGALRLPVVGAMGSIASLRVCAQPPDWPLRTPNPATPPAFRLQVGARARTPSQAGRRWWRCWPQTNDSVCPPACLSPPRL